MTRRGRRRTSLGMLVVVSVLLGACGTAPGRRATKSEVTARVRTGGQPCGVVATDEGVWVTDAAAGQLLRIDRARHVVVRRTAVDPTPCELVAGYGALWIATQSGVLDRVDPTSGRVVAKIAVGSMSYEPLVAFGSVWVSNRNSGTVSQIDPATNAVVRTVQLPGLLPGGLAQSGTRLYVGNDTAGDKTIAVVDPKSGTSRHLVAGGRPAFVTAADRWIFVANQDDGTVSRLDAETGAVVETVPSGVSPVNLTTLPGPRPEVWVPDDTGNLLIRIDATSGQVLERMPAGGGPAVVSADGQDVWVTNFRAGSVWRVHPGAR